MVFYAWYEQNDSTMNSELSKVQSEVKKHLQESETLKTEIESLDKIISKQKHLLTSLENKELLLRKTSTKELDSLKKSVAKLDASIKEEQNMYTNFISKHRDEISHKDYIIKSLQKDLSDNVHKVPSFSFVGKTVTVLATSKDKSKKKTMQTDEEADKHIVKKKDRLQCGNCDFYATSDQRLRIHRNIEHVVYFPCDICQHQLKSEKELNNHKVHLHSSSLSSSRAIKK